MKTDISQKSQENIGKIFGKSIDRVGRSLGVTHEPGESVSKLTMQYVNTGQPVAKADGKKS